MPIQRLEGPSLGTVTANTLITTASVNATAFHTGANVSLNTSAAFVGNSTVNTTITSSDITAAGATASVNAVTFHVGANVSLNTSAVFVGNSTVNTVITSSTGVVTGVVSSSKGFATALVAGESLAALDAVYVEPALTGGTAGRVYKMDADVLVKSSQAFFAGFALASASAAASVNIQQSGVISGFSGLTAGAVYYAGSAAGAITATKPLHPLPVGIAISTTQLLINTGVKREEEQSENISAVYGYALGGSTGAPVATTDRITFTTSATAASTVSNLSQARYDVCNVSDASVYGYTLGGYDGSYIVTTTDRTIFSTSVTAAATAAALSQARYNLPVGISDGAVYGYAMGGVSAYLTPVVTTDRITFSTSIAAASTTSNLVVTRALAAGVSDGVTYGYITGGFTSTGTPVVNVASAERLTFGTGISAASTVSNLSQARRAMPGVSDNATYGYILGGFTGAVVTTTDRITFSTSATAASTTSNLSVARFGASGVSDGNLYGYAMGGYTDASVATTDRITFTTSATAASTTSNLTTTRALGAGLSDGAV